MLRSVITHAGPLWARQRSGPVDVPAQGTPIRALSNSTTNPDAHVLSNTLGGQLKPAWPDVTRQESFMSFKSSQRHPHPKSGCSVRGCKVVDNWEEIWRCEDCQAAMYCGQKHQHADFPAHRLACDQIKRARFAYEEAEKELRDTKGDDIFNQDPPRFWDIPETRPYMRVRLAYIDAILLINTVQAVILALQHLGNMLYLCRNDAIGVRHIMPTLYLRLGRDQDAYDFSKWWVTTRQGYNWSKKYERYPNIRQADAFKDLKDFVRGASVSLSLLSASR